jgi:periplasmic divalent cation tolerance protein
MNDAPHLMVQTTVGTQADAQDLARLAIEHRLAACVHIDAIQSVYRWQGQMEHDSEWRLSFKTLPHLVQDLVQALEAAHPYELPAFEALPAMPLTAQWSDWVEQQLSNRP